jgi:Uma2 family endonuclease
MDTKEIVLPITEPETEWVRGRALRKVSPTRKHARLQTEFGSALNAWSKGRGEVGSEWRFRIAPPGEARRPLVPDLAFVRNERLKGLSPEEAETPIFAPDVVVEIRSPGDRDADVADKVALYLAAGTALVILVDPERRTCRLIDARRVQELGIGDTLRHDALPGFALDLRALFATLVLPRS